MSDVKIVDSEEKRLNYDLLGQAEVFAIYKSLIDNPGRGNLDSRGKTYYQAGRKYKYTKSEATFTVGEDYHRQTSFTPEQEKLNDIVRLKMMESITSETSGFLINFKKAWDKSRDRNLFEDILCDAYLSSIFDSFDKSPNLTPAFYGFLVASNAGAEGLQLALNESLYPRSVVGHELPSNYPSFVGVHGAMDGDKGWEVQCGAPVLAMRIIKEGQKCLNYAGLQVDEVSNTRFVGPTTSIMSNIAYEITSRMEILGYRNLKKPK